MVGRRSREIYKSLRTRISQQLQGLLWNTTLYGEGRRRRIHFAWAHNYKNSWKLLLFVICFYTPFCVFFVGVVRIPKLLRLSFVDVSLLQRERERVSATMGIPVRVFKLCCGLLILLSIKIPFGIIIYIVFQTHSWFVYFHLSEQQRNKFSEQKYLFTFGIRN